MESTCPISVAIREIRGGHNREENDDINVVAIGGANTHELVCDDVAYYITRRKIAFARAEVAKLNNVVVPPVNTFVGKTYRDVAAEILAEIPRRLYDQLVATCDIIARIEDLLSRVVCGGKNPINITMCSLCDGVLDSIHEDPRRLFNAETAFGIALQICMHVSACDINVLLTSPLVTRVVMPTEPQITPIDLATRIDDPGPAQEMIVAEYLRTVEDYHCVLIRSLSSVHTMCDEIVNKLKR